MKSNPDFSIEGSGRFCTVYLVRPLNSNAEDFLYSRLGEEAQLLGEAVAVETRFLGAIVDDLRSEGFVVR